jgi:hypothetical protein
MAEAETDTRWQVIAVPAGAGKPETLEAFFIAKLGHCVGKRTFKELVAFAKDKTKSATGDVAVILTAKGGKIVSLQEV